MTDPTQDILDRHGISPPPCGAYLSDGWFSLVERLIVDLIDLGWDRDCHQIKVKFGGLRFYVGEASDACRARIAAAEGEAESTCSICGAPGSFKNSDGWFVSCGVHGSNRE